MKRRTVQLARKNSNVFAQFDQKQISELKEAFSFIDQNGDGVVDRDDLKEVWASLGKFEKSISLTLTIITTKSNR